MVPAGTTLFPRIVGYQSKRRGRRLARNRQRHNDLRRRSLLGCNLGGHFKGGEKSLASFGKLPAGVVPQNVLRAENIKIGRER